MKFLIFLRYFLYNCPSEMAEIFCVVVTLLIIAFWTCILQKPAGECFRLG